MPGPADPRAFGACTAALPPGHRAARPRLPRRPTRASSSTSEGLKPSSDPWSQSVAASTTSTLDASGNGPASTPPGGVDEPPRASSSPSAFPSPAPRSGTSSPSSLPVAWLPAVYPVTSVRTTAAAPHTTWLATWLAAAARAAQYRLMLLFRAPTWGKVAALVLAGLPIVVLGGAALRAATVADLSWGEAAQVAFFVLQNVPGTDITRFSELGARIVLVAIHLLSLYTFATLVGLLTEDVRATVEAIRSGNFPIPASGHTVILDPRGEASRLATLLRQVMAARQARGSGDSLPGCVAVLSAMPKDQLDGVVAEALPRGGAGVVTRTGSALQVADLERVSAGAAHTVLLLGAPPAPAAAGRAAGQGGGDSDGGGQGGAAYPSGALPPDLQQEITLAALRALRSPLAPPTARPGPLAQWTFGAGKPAGRAGVGARGAAAAAGGLGSRTGGKGLGAAARAAVSAAAAAAAAGGWRQTVIVETCGGGQPAAAREGEGGGEEDPLQVVCVSAASAACRVALQCAAQPGLAAVFDALVCRADDARFHVVPLPAHLEGMSFGEARRRFTHATLCGVHRPDPQPAPHGAEGGGKGADSNGSSSNGADAVGGPGTSGGSGCGLIEFCPPDDCVLQPGWSLALLAARRHDCTALTRSVEAPSPPPLTPCYAGARSGLLRRLLLLSADSAISPDLAAALHEFVAPDCELTIVSPSPCAGLAMLGAGRGPGSSRLRCRAVCGDPLDPATLQRAGVATADAAILTGLDIMEPAAADAHVLAVAVQLQRVLAAPSSEVAESPAASAAPAAESSDPWVTDDQENFWSRTSSSGDTTSLSSMSMDDDYMHEELYGAGSHGSSHAGPLGWLQSLSKSLRGGHGASSRGQSQPPVQPTMVAPARPLVFVTTLRDQRNAVVLQDIAAAASRRAVGAMVAAAAAAMGGAGSGGSRDGAWNEGGSGGNRFAVASGAVSRARGMSVEVIDPEALVSGMMAQVGSDPRLVTGLADLLDEAGCELYCKRPDRYGISALQRLTWGQVCEAVRASGSGDSGGAAAGDSTSSTSRGAAGGASSGGDVAIGYLHRGHLCLAPRAATPLVLVGGDRLVVLSAGYGEGGPEGGAGAKG